MVTREKRREEYADAGSRRQEILRKRSVRKSILRISDEGLRLLILNVATMIYLIFRIRTGKLEVSCFVVLVTATMQLSYELFHFVKHLNSFYSLNVYTGDLVRVLEEKDNVESGVGEEMTERVDSVSLRKVSFAYPGKERLVLRDVDMEFCRGQRIAVVGHNGAGKTTFARLLMRLYDVENGGIAVIAAEAAVWKFSGRIQRLLPELNRDRREKYEKWMGYLTRTFGNYDIMRNVDFGYRNREPIIRGFHYTFCKGGLYAVVGPAGTGKTTILLLMAGLLRETGGALYYNGNNRRELSRDSLWKRLIYVLED